MNVAKTAWDNGGKEIVDKLGKCAAHAAKGGEDKGKEKFFHGK